MVRISLSQISQYQTIINREDRIGDERGCIYDWLYQKEPITYGNEFLNKRRRRRSL
jgi:hypothetical protein